MMNYFIFDGIRSTDYGIGIEQCPVRPIPERNIEKIEIPGKSGYLIKDYGTFKNITQTYEVYFNAKDIGTTSKAREIALWLMGASGYKILEDSYEPDFFRKAVYVGPADIDNWMLRYGRVKLEFECKPQWYSRLGQIPIELSNGQKLYNRMMPALPLIRAYGTSGNLIVGSTVLQLKSIDGYIDIDCDTENAFKGTMNQNGNIFIPEFPAISNGETAISWEGNITRVVITPRWWTI